MLFFLNLLRTQDEGGRGRGTKGPPFSLFSPATSTIKEITTKTFFVFIFNSFVTLVQNFKAILSASPKLLNFKQYCNSVQNIKRILDFQVIFMKKM